ncbi:D-Ala-D-Ala carboxypeptidase family metallohydrolase [Synergistaceae bacterium OttesenSCG-928-D05]|nr:D-Ala-D-Ala carboxypeptidase family metallohydrolase [Synergistaceae bacterium OttesenSCG-928-D05]
MRINEIQLSENFKLKEFECPCCKTVKLHPLLLERLQQLRNIWQKAVVITSGYRCEKHNAEVGGVPRSRHLQGRAADVRIPESQQEEFKRLAELCGFTKIILYGGRGFVHVEV